MPPSKFNPLMQLNEAKNVGGGPHGAPEGGASGSERQPAGVKRGDGTANLGTTTKVKTAEDSRPKATGGKQRQPSGVDRFNGGSV